MNRRNKQQPNSAYELAQGFIDITLSKVNVDHSPYIGQLYTAVLECLTESEACKLLGSLIEQDISPEYSLCARIAKDIERKVLPCHRKLAKTLLAKFPVGNAKETQAYIKELGSLLHQMPDSFRIPVLDYLLRSKFKYLQLMAIKSLQHKGNNQVKPELIELWRSAPSKVLAEYISDNFPTRFIIENFDELQTQLIDLPIPLSRLYKRIGKANFKKLRGLSKKNEIRYLYALTKLGKSLDKKEALKIVKRNKYSDDLGLLIWSLGKMKQWQVLRYVCKEIEQIWLEKIELIAKTRATSLTI